jgi:hypothetical protein
MPVKSSMPGVTVDAASVGEFMDGIFGVNKKANAGARRALERSLIDGILYAGIRHAVSRRKRVR